MCSSPGCNSMPNYYLHVPAPEDLSAPTAEMALVKSLSDAKSRPTPTCERTERATVSLSTTPSVMLRRLAPPATEFPIFEGVTEIGARSPAQVVVDDPSVSSRHACLECRRAGKGDAEFVLSDQGSKNGTFVRGERIQRQRIQIGDRIRFARVEFELTLPADATPWETMQL